MHPLFEKADALTGEVIEAAAEVQKHFGIELLENIYKQCLAQEMRVRVILKGADGGDPF